MAKSASQRTKSATKKEANKAAAQQSVQAAKAQHAAATTAAQPRPAHAPAAATPARPAPQVQMTPPISPFLNSDDLMALANFNGDLSQKLLAIDSSLGDLSTDTTLQKNQTDKSAKQSTSDSTDAMIARGLFQSSLKDAAVYDIEAQRTLQQKYLDDRLTRATLDAGTQKKALEDWKTSFLTGLNQKAVENARAVTPVVPAAAAPAATPQAAQAAAKSFASNQAQQHSHAEAVARAQAPAAPKAASPEQAARAFYDRQRTLASKATATARSRASQ